MLFFKLIKFELLQSLRRYQECLIPIWFLLLITSIFAISLQQDLLLLEKAAPGILWSSILLAMILSLPHLFTADDQSGALEQMMLAPISLSYFIIIKLCAYWIKTCIPILLLTPVVGLLLHLSFNQILINLYALLLGTPTFALLSAFGAALTLRFSNNALLLSLLTLPLCIPILIFSLSMVTCALTGLSIVTPVCMLLALFILSAAILPFVIAFSLRIGVN